MHISLFIQKELKLVESKNYYFHNNFNILLEINLYFNIHVIKQFNYNINNSMIF